MKPKNNYKIENIMQKNKDCCYTPDYAIEPLIKYIPKEWYIWEPASGDGRMVNYFISNEYSITGTDILTGRDFFTYDYDQILFDCIITNPPFSRKFDFINRCYEIGRPWALLMPVETLGAKSANTLFKKYGMQMIVFDKRIDFYMPNKGFSGSAQFPTAWFTYGLNLPSDIVYETLNKPNRRKNETQYTA